MDQKYQNRSAIITGASGGLGRAMAVQLAKGGMSLWLVGRTPADLEAVAEEVRGAGSPEVHVAAVDLEIDGTLAHLVNEVGVQHPYLFALINNAGLMHPETIMSGKPERWRAMFDVNVLSPLQGCKAAIEVMRGHGKPGHLINIGSLAARFTAGGVYGASKIAQEMISRSLRQELENDDIRITSIVPGGFVSKLARYLEPETIDGLTQNAAAKGIHFSDRENHRFLGDPAHVANLVEFIIDQPIDINLQEIVIQPPVSVAY